MPQPDPGMPSGITSLKEATFEHQQYALAHGYSSVRDALIDEMAAMLRDLRERVEALEQDTEPRGIPVVEDAYFKPPEARNDGD